MGFFKDAIIFVNVETNQAGANFQRGEMTG